MTLLRHVSFRCTATSGASAYPNGHRNVIFARRGNPTLPIPESEQKGKTGAQALYEYLKKYNGIAISHTSATTMGTDWRDNDPEVEPLVEIYQGDRVSAEYEGAPKAAMAAMLTGAPGRLPSGGLCLERVGQRLQAWRAGFLRIIFPRTSRTLHDRRGLQP